MGLPGEDLEDLYEHAPCGYLSLRPDGRIFKVNRTFASWSSYEPDELLGKRFHDLLNVATRIFYETHFAPLLRMQGFFNEVALDLLAKDGRPLPVLVNAAERKDRDGNLLFLRLTVFNATDRRNYERELIQARAKAEAIAKELHALNETLENRISDAVKERLQAALELEKAHEASQLREQFIAVLGHDLRNPIAAISAGASILARRPLDAASANVVALMKGSILRASTLIDNVMDFARGRLGSGINLERTTDKAIEATLDQVVNELRTVNPDRKIDTDYYIPLSVSLDHARIAQMTSNLLANALTYGASDIPVRLHASVDPQTFELWVANAGPQISEEAMERLFQPFFRGEVRASQQGLGLGLHIALEIAHAHGGTLTVRSSSEETRFTFNMPLKEAAGN